MTAQEDAPPEMEDTYSELDAVIKPVDVSRDDEEDGNDAIEGAQVMADIPEEEHAQWQDAGGLADASAV
jgi:hypothetical protein